MKQHDNKYRRLTTPGEKKEMVKFANTLLPKGWQLYLIADILGKNFNKNKTFNLDKTLQLYLIDHYEEEKYNDIIGNDFEHQDGLFRVQGFGEPKIYVKTFCYYKWKTILLEELAHFHDWIETKKAGQTFKSNHSKQFKQLFNDLRDKAIKLKFCTADEIKDPDKG